ncbi:GTP cyclohydrolase 1-like [Convolutriloba macropyga]|uniref:GTP cyclohydrolase 1-like n=1 Tax=Convolutriloba macropyga TaxID=536237 RepID=UPI003F5228B2
MIIPRRDQSPDSFDEPPSAGGSSFKDMVLLAGIDFCSLCEHHMLPFHGVVNVGYIPGAAKNIVHSEIVGIVHAFAGRLQLQERLGEEIADAVMAAFSPEGLAVMVQASHISIASQGGSPSRFIVTSCAFRGAFDGADNPLAAARLREDFRREVTAGCCWVSAPDQRGSAQTLDISPSMGGSSSR